MNNFNGISNNNDISSNDNVFGGFQNVLINPYHVYCPFTKKVICYCENIKINKEKELAKNDYIFKLFLRKFPQYQNKFNIVNENEIAYSTSTRNIVCPIEIKKENENNKFYVTKTNKKITTANTNVKKKGSRENLVHLISLQWQAYYQQNPIVCTYCKRTDHQHEIIQCKHCKTSFHSQCSRNKNVYTIPIEFRRLWGCQRCKKCIVCDKKTNIVELVCNYCDRMYHPQCHNPKLTTPVNRNEIWNCSYCYNCYLKYQKK